MLIPARALAAALVVATLFAAAPGHAAPYVFDSKRSSVRFHYSLAFSTGEGRFTGLSGTASIDDAAPRKTKVQVNINTRTLRASDSLAQAELRGSSFFAVDSHPQMRFVSRSVRAESATSAEIAGDMTVKGITRPIVLQVTLQPPNARGEREMRATTSIRRADFGMTAYALLVGQMVQIDIRAVLVPAR